MTRRLSLGLLAALLLAAPDARAAEVEPRSWEARVAAAVRYAERRAGVESFALIGERGRMYGFQRRRVEPSASVLKAMLLVAYLRHRSVSDRPLRKADRRLLGPMIRRSDNATATRVLGFVGAGALERLALRARMHHFRLRSPWGLSEITAAGQARFFRRIDVLVPRRHRAYALSVLARIVRSQRWGIPPAKPPGWSIHFKGGWGSGTGWVTHQVALLRDGERRLSLAILTRYNPSHEYGTRTIRGIAARLLATPLP